MILDIQNGTWERIQGDASQYKYFTRDKNLDIKYYNDLNKKHSEYAKRVENEDNTQTYIHYNSKNKKEVLSTNHLKYIINNENEKLAISINDEGYGIRHSKNEMNYISIHNYFKIGDKTYYKNWYKFENDEISEAVYIKLE